MKKQPSRVLLVEESDEAARLILDEIHDILESQAPERLDRLSLLNKIVQQGHWAAVIIGWSYPLPAALKAIRAVRALDARLPAILVLEQGGEEAIVAGIKAGAFDVVSRGQLGRLASALQECLRVKDIKPRRSSESKQSSALETPDEILHKIPDGVIVRDAALRAVYVNPAMEQMLGYQPGELIGTRFEDILPADQHAIAQAAFDRRVQGQADQYEVPLLRKDGSSLMALVNGVPRFVDGKFAGSVAVFSDISAIKRIENELRSLKEYNQSIVQNMYEGVGVGDGEGYITYANPALASMLGYTLQELVGQNWKELVPQDQYHIVEAAEHRRQEGGTDRYDLEMLNKDGERILVEISGTPLLENGQFRGSLFVLTDITARKRAEELLRQQAEDLAALYAVSLTITASQDFPSLVHSVVEQAKKLLHASGGGLALCDPKRQELRVYEEFTSAGQSFAGLVLKYGEGAAGMVAKTGKPLIINDYRTWPDRLLAYEASHPYTATLSIPVIWYGQVTGVLQITDDMETRTFTQDDVNLLSLFADQAAIAIENARLLEAERKIREQAETLSEAAKALSGSLDLNEVMHLILRQLNEILTFDTASVLLYNRAGEPELLTGIGYTDEQATGAAAIAMLRESRILQGMWIDHQPVIIDDVEQHPDWIRTPGAEEVRSFLAVPVLLQGQMAGVLMLDSSSTSFFNEESLHLVQSLVPHIAIAIQNARLFQAERSARERAEALREAARIIASTLSLDEVLGVVLDQLARVLPFDSGSTMLVEDTQVVIKAWRGYANVSKQELQNLRFSVAKSETCGAVVRSGEPLVIHNVQQDPRWTTYEFARDTQSWLGVPLWVRDQVIGMFSLDRLSPDGFDDEEIAIAQNFADHAAVAIDNARLYAGEEQRATELMALRQASLTVTASLELGPVLDTILDSALRFIPGAGNAHIFLYNEADGRLSFGAALSSLGRHGSPVAMPRQSGLTYTVARTGQAVVVNDMKQHALYEDAPAEWSGAIVGLPLKMGQRVVGVMNVSYPQPHQFTEGELRVLGLLGDQAAIAIENARLYERAATERRHLGLLYDLSRELAGSLNRDEILDKAITLTCQALGALVGEVFTYNPETAQLNLRAVHGQNIASMEVLDHQINLKPGMGLTGWVAQNSRPAYSPDVSKDERWMYVNALDKDAHSAMAAPILDNERLLGVMTVLHRQENAFTPDQLTLLQAICQQVGLALTNAESYDQVHNLVEMLAAEQYRLESLLERLPVGVLLLDAEYRLLVANLQGRQILEKVNPREPGQILTHLGPYPIEEFCQTFAPTGTLQEGQALDIAVNGTTRMIVEAEGRIIGTDNPQWVITLRDVTLERESQERIRQQERLATVGQLAAGIAHDFNNIMAAILVYTDLIMGDHILSTDSKNRIIIIQQQVQRATSLIRQILDFSRRSVMEQTSMDLLPFIKELDKLLKRILPETIRLELNYEPGTYMIHADPTRLQQVFMNLAVNARDAMPQGGSLRFEVERLFISNKSRSAHPDLPRGEWVRIQVSDSGTGIPPDTIPHIFDPFFTTKGVGQGTGLGLAQVYGIIQQHQGHIFVNSQLGLGTQFEIYLPALEVPLESLLSATSSTKFDGKGATVLIAEDDEITREALQALLEEQNFQVISAENGREALKLFERGEKISVLVSDIVMPEMGGITLHENLKLRWPDVKTLFVTGHPLDVRDQATLERGGIHWLQKPFSVQEFNQAIKALLG